MSEKARRLRSPAALGVAIAAGFLAIMGAVVVAGDAYVNREAGHICAQVSADEIENVGAVPGSLDIEGGWQLWPTGMKCTYPGLGGGRVAIGPPPGFSVILVAALALGGVSIGGFALSFPRDRTSKGDNA
ncbi:hypothetical protein [Homoserinibacter sp. GY 40078]|uniref:hypothetical protein n=1 Tax=Homoserinibacter sp. GY 40078 TaxID=2603275 RepID=UPI0011C812A3|nr:hypothetical protein [Homoserinibacter sp. GY 40078]TXK18882.1 hypothetical protein FVQ89_02785 [Homoserinibacter sp. GY 40078]